MKIFLKKKVYEEIKVPWNENNINNNVAEKMKKKT